VSTLPSSQRIGLGTYRLGASTYDACRAALDLGYRHLDTAALYRNEDAVARAIISSEVKRAEIFVVSKIHVRDLGVPERILPAARERVDLLGHIDLLLMHAPVGDWVQGWEIMQEVATWPEVAAVGVSNFDLSHLQSLGPPLPPWNQIEVTPFLPRHELTDWCQKRGMGLVAHSPLTKGGRLADATLQQIAKLHGTTAAQVLIAWGLAQGFVMIPSSSNRAHLAENLAARDLVLTAADMQSLSTLEDGFATHPQLLR
jgi:diketogulonate reductase-like aldo/keto reductase